MAIRSHALVNLFVALVITQASRASAQEYRKLAPYSSIRWTIPEISVDGEWLALRSIDGIPVEEIAAWAQNKYEEDWYRRFGEDLVQVLTEMGHAPGKSVKLKVRNLATGKERVLESVALTSKNRESLKSLEGRIPLDDLRPDHLKRVLDDFKIALDHRWSYRHTNGADFDGAIAVLRTKIDDGIAPNDFGIELQKIVALGIDGHAEVSGYALPCVGYLPFLIEPEGDRFVAFKPKRDGFLAAGFPYVVKIDGQDVARWCEAAGVLVPKGSPQFVRRQSLRQLRSFDYFRGELKLPRTETLEVELADNEVKTRKRLTLPVGRTPPQYGEWPRGGSRILKNNIGYLRLAVMDGSAVREIRTWMPTFRDTAGLIIDVRDNGGGSREALRELYSYLAKPTDAPRVFTVAAYRLHNSHENDHLAWRFMYRANAEEWTAAEHKAIAEFVRTFKPQWEPPRGKFSDWHYMVLSRLEDARVFHYSKPVVVLMNAKCFSATDVFLAGVKGIPNVTLVGTASGGGSSFKQSVYLGETPLELEIGSIISFQADGGLFDRNGVEPDVVVEANPAYHIGGRDNVLETAVQRILTK